MEVPTILIRPIFEAYGSGHIPTKYGQTYGTNVPGIRMEQLRQDHTGRGASRRA